MQVANWVNYLISIPQASLKAYYISVAMTSGMLSGDSFHSSCPKASCAAELQVVVVVFKVSNQKTCSTNENSADMGHLRETNAGCLPVFAGSTIQIHSRWVDREEKNLRLEHPWHGCQRWQ